MKKGLDYFIADSPNEIELMETHNRNGMLVLLSSNVGFENLKNIRSPYTFYDEHIEEQDWQKIALNVQNFLWTWFIDDAGNDKSRFNDCSLGLSFAGPVEVLVTTIQRYLFSFRNLLSVDDNVYIATNTEDIFFAIIHSLHKEIGFCLHIIDKDAPLGCTKTASWDPNLRKYYLSNNFLGGSFFNILVGWFARAVNLLSKEKNDVLIMSAGKLDGYFRSYLYRDSKVNYVLPIRYFIKKISLKSSNLNKSFYFHSAGWHQNKNTQDMIGLLKLNIGSKVNWIESNCLFDVLDRHIFRYFGGAIKYYCNAKTMLLSSKPKLLVASVESWPTQVLVAQAAKSLNILTAIIPHGLCGKTYKPLRVGETKVFDLCFAFGNNDVMECLDKGVEKERIFITSFPYFSRFLPLRKNSLTKTNKPKVLILVPDFSNISPDSSTEEIYTFMIDVVAMLNIMQCEIIGFKGRNDDFFSRLGFNEKVTINNKDYPLITGYETFPKVAKEADFIIGPISTSIIEAGLLGVDYYPFKSINQNLMMSISKPIYKILHVAKNISQLKDNIVNKRIYQDDFCVTDLISLKKSHRAEELFLNFEDSLNKAMVSNVLL